MYWSFMGCNLSNFVISIIKTVEIKIKCKGKRRKTPTMRGIPDQPLSIVLTSLHAVGEWAIIGPHKIQAGVFNMGDINSQPPLVIS